MISEIKSRNSFVRKEATKIFTTRIIQGYQITSEKCNECLVPLMSFRGMTNCVVCEAWNNAHTVGGVDEPEIAAPNDLQLCCKSSHTVVGSGRSVSENSRRETRNDVNHQEKHRRMANSVIVVTEDGVELSPGTGSVDSRNSTEVESDESVADGCDDGAEAIEVASRGGEHDKFVSKRETSEQTHSETNSALFLAALNKLARLPRQQEKKLVRLHDIIEEEHQSNSSCDVVASDHVSISPSCVNPESVSAPLGDTGGETITVSELNAEIIHDIDSTLACYNNGKAFASQVIQNTDSILNDLVKSKSGAQRVSDNSGSICVSPMTGSGDTSRHLNKLVTECVLNSSECDPPKTTPIDSPRINTLASPIDRKRITINNLASGFASTTVNSSTRMKQKTSFTNSLNSNMIDEFLADPTASSRSATSFISDQRNDLPEASEAEHDRESVGDFFSELRHKALMAKATSYQKKLEADGYCTKRNALSAMNIDTEVNHDEAESLECSSADPDTTESIHLNGTRVESSIPDDEKKYIALKSVREEKVVQPFDEFPQDQESSEPIEVCSSAALSLSAPVSKEIDTESLIPKSTGSAEVQAVTRPSHPSEESVSVISLSSTVHLQSNRIAQLEADALHKHQLAELAAASAREVLEEMINARKIRRNKGERNQKTIVTKVMPSESAFHGDSDQLSPRSTPSSEQKVETKSSAASAHEVLELIINERKEENEEGETERKETIRMKGMTSKVPSESPLIRDNGDSDQLSLCSTLSSEQKPGYKCPKVDSFAKNEMYREGGEDTTYTYSDHGYSVASASQCEKRTYFPKTPKEESSMGSRDSKSSVAKSELSTSTYSSAGDINSRHYRRHDRTRPLRSFSATHSRPLDTKTNIFLPSLCTPDSISSRTSQQRNLQSIHRSHSASPRYHLRGKQSVQTPTHHSMKPNHLLSYSPRGDIKETRKMLTNPSSSSGEARLRAIMRPEPISAVYPNERHPSISHHIAGVGPGLPREQSAMLFSPIGDIKETRKVPTNPSLFPGEARFRAAVRPDPISAVQHHPSMPHHILSEVGSGLPREQYAMPSRMTNQKPSVDTNTVASFQYHPFGGKSLTPKSVHEQNRYGFRSNLQIPIGNRHPTTRSMDALSLAQNHDPMVSLSHDMPRQYHMGVSASAALSPTIMTAFPHSYSNNATVLPTNPYGGQSITPKSFHEQKRYSFRSYDQQPFHFHQTTPRSLDAMPLAHHPPHPEWMNSMSRQLSMMPNEHSNMFGGHYVNPSSMRPLNSPARVSFFDNFEEDEGDRPQFLSNVGGQSMNLHHQAFRQQHPYVLH